MRCLLAAAALYMRTLLSQLARLRCAAYLLRIAAAFLAAAALRPAILRALIILMRLWRIIIILALQALILAYFLL